MNLEQLQALSDAELNELAAVKVMGWEKRGTSTAYFLGDELVRTSDPTSFGTAWNPTTDMNDAWMLVKILHEDCYGFALGNIDEEWSAWFLRPGSHSHQDEGRIVCKEASRAITIASILAKESEDK